MQKLSQEDFIARAQKLHPEYFYNKVNYINSKTKIEIICPKHGSFWQYPYAHLNGQSCPKCSQEKSRLTKEKFIEKAEAIYGKGKFNFDKTVIKNARTKFIVTCVKHGDLIKDYNHFIVRKQGCNLCRLENDLNQINLSSENPKADYDILISKAKGRKKFPYSERHHILPKSMGGQDSSDNLVYLTPSEHYRAHFLLWKIYQNKEMALALWRMSITGGKFNALEPEIYEQLRKQVIDSKSYQGRKVYCLELDKTFETEKEACKFLGINQEKSCQISAACIKHYPCFIWKDRRRFHWCFEEEKDILIEQKDELIEEEKNFYISRGKKISAAKKGKPTKGISVICLETKEVFKSAKDALDKFGIKSRSHFLLESARAGNIFYDYHFKILEAGD